MEKKATRIGFSEELAILGGENEKIFVIDADLGKSCKSDKFATLTPKEKLTSASLNKMRRALRQV